jgi:NADH-quinone oxidoreductase subunit L
MTTAVLAIAGAPGLSGFFSKDAILASAFAAGGLGKVLWFVGVVTAMLTAFYMFRLWYLTFLGKPRSEAAEHHHANPASMLTPLVILAVLSICGGWIGIERFAAYLAPATGARVVDESAGHLEVILSVIAVITAAIGWYIAHVFYRQKPERPAELAASMPGVYKLVANKYYVDEFYGLTVVKPLIAISTYVLDWVVDRAILGGAAWLLGGIATFSGAILQRWQSGNLRSYAAWLAAGAAALLLFLFGPTLLSAYGIDIKWMGH